MPNIARISQAIALENFSKVESLMPLIEIHKLTRKEKLTIMETLWEDLSKDEENFDSPEWHGEALRQTEIQYKSGELDVVDWNNAKKDLRKKFE